MNNKKGRIIMHDTWHIFQIKSNLQTNSRCKTYCQKKFFFSNKVLEKWFFSIASYFEKRLTETYDENISFNMSDI